MPAAEAKVSFSNWTSRAISYMVPLNLSQPSEIVVLPLRFLKRRQKYEVQLTLRVVFLETPMRSDSAQTDTARIFCQ